MPLQAIVKNFRGVTESLIEISPIALLCGENGAGKTSMARAIAAAVTGKVVPYTDVTKKDCKVLLRHGTHTGSVTVGSDAGTASVEWPAAELRTMGNPPHASIIAAGLTGILTMKKDDALSYMIKVLQAEPTDADLRSAFEQIGVDTSLVDAIAGVIKAQGWDAAHKRAVEKGQQLKGAWSQITGSGYGTKKAEEWYPEGWEDSLLNLTPESIQADIEAATRALEAAIGNAAVNQAERQRLQELADKTGEYAEAIPLREEDVRKAREALEATQKELAETPNPNVPAHELECPHCEKKVLVMPSTTGQFILSKPKKTATKDTKEEAKKSAGLCGQLSKCQSDLGTAQRALDEATRLHNSARDAVAKLAQMPADVAGASPAAVEDARKSLNALTAKADMLRRYKESRLKAEAITQSAKIVALLDEGGLRKKKLSECLDAFMSHYIEPICVDIGMPLVSIDCDLNVDLATVSYPMLSRGEQFRVRCVLQLALAKLEGAGMLIIDDVDAMVGQWRGGLMKALYNIGIPAVVCLAMKKGDKVPDLKAMGAGMTYWCENGVCLPYGEERAAA